MSQVTFEFPDAFEFAETVAAAPNVVEAELVTATDRVAIYGMGVSIRATPVDTGHLRRSHAQQPTSYSGGAATGGWGNAVPYAVYVEEGTRPHYPPLNALWGWAKRKGGLDPFALQQSIGMWGTEAQPFMQPGYEAAESRVDAEFGGAIQRIVEALGG